jgi:hypothetical protein
VRTVLLAIAAAAALAGSAATDRAAGLASQARPASGEACTFAVLRRDGVIVPFASYDDGRWLNRWPEPGRRVEIPISLEASPKSWWLRDRPVGTWTAWPVQGESRAIHVRNPVNLTVECQRHVGLQTDYSSISPPVPRDMQPHPKDGLATTGDVMIEPVEVLTASSLDWPRVLEAIKEPFAASEGRVLSKASQTRVTVIDPQKRAQFPLEIEVLFRSLGLKAGTHALYFEAVRRYSRRPPSSPILSIVPDRRPLAYGAGWIVVGASGELSVQQPLTVELSDNEREDLLYAMPLGSFRLGDHRYWALQRAGWGYERFEIVEIVEPAVKMSFRATGGTCR